MASAISRVLVQAPRRTWGSYIKHLEARPRLTKSATSVVAAVLGDALAQYISNSDKQSWKYDWARTTRLAMFNAGMGVAGHEYYKVLDGRVMPHASKSAAAVASKVAIDQLVWAPVCTAIFYLYKVAMEGRTSDYFSEVQEKYVPTLVAGYKLWVPAHVVNFALVPNRQRILYANAVSVFGTYILSRAQAGDYSRRPSPAATGDEAAEPRRRHVTEVLNDGVVLEDQ